MKNFLNNLKQSLDDGLNQETTDNLNIINKISKLVDEKSYAKQTANINKPINNKVDMLDCLDAIQNNVVAEAQIKADDLMFKVMAQIINHYDLIVTGLLLDEFGVKDKEIEDIIFEEYVLVEVSEILSTICLFEVEYCDYLEDNIFYNKELVKVKKEILKILKK